MTVFAGQLAEHGDCLPFLQEVNSTKHESKFQNSMQLHGLFLKHIWGRGVVLSGRRLLPWPALWWLPGTSCQCHRAAYGCFTATEHNEVRGGTLSTIGMCT
jgi:hypothetical protein